eukprot:12794383-Alexandrium_andersonii.AAC.1
MATAKCARSAKKAQHAGDPVSYRGLLLTSVLYRLCAKIRLRHLEAWAEGWMPKQAFAGAPGRGAGDA